MSSPVRIAPHPENENFMTIITRLDQWQERGIISTEQHTLLAGLSRGEPFSLFLELNIFLYAGILAFVARLGWTLSTWSQQLGSSWCLPSSPPCSPRVFGTASPARPPGPVAKLLRPVCYSTTCLTSAAS